MGQSSNSVGGDSSAIHEQLSRRQKLREMRRNRPSKKQETIPSGLGHTVETSKQGATTSIQTGTETGQIFDVDEKPARVKTVSEDNSRLASAEDEQQSQLEGGDRTADSRGHDSVPSSTASVPVRKAARPKSRKPKAGKKKKKKPEN